MTLTPLFRRINETVDMEREEIKEATEDDIGVIIVEAEAIGEGMEVATGVIMTGTAADMVGTVGDTAEAVIKADMEVMGAMATAIEWSKLILA